MKNTKTLTFHSAINYGAILQTIGLQTALENLNLKNEVIDYTDKCMRQYKLFDFSEMQLKEKIKKIMKIVLYGHKMNKRYYIFNKFIRDNMVLTKKVENVQQIEEIIEASDILITGSDQVWSTDIVGELSDIYTLNFGYESNKRISYAASIGTSQIDKQYENDYKEKISKIDFVSVREKSAQKELNKILPQNQIDTVLDPTMLLNREEWNKKIESISKAEKERYILAYTMEVNKEYVKIANELSKKTGLKIIYLDYRNYGFKNVLRNAYCDNPYEFINLVKNAEYVVTNSFHGTAFSIIFNKKFWAIPHKTKSARVTNLLELLNLSGRTVTTLEEFNRKDYDMDINYSEVNKKLDVEKSRSLEWLKKSVNDRN